MYEALFRQLAALHPGDAPVTSAYLDMRPQATGEKPAVRSGEIVLRARLNEIEKTFRPRGPELDSFLADRERIEHYLKRQFDPAVHGLAIFACSQRQLFETVEVGTPFDSEVVVDRLPDLYQLAKLLDDHETVVTAVVDTNTARIFVTEYGRLEELVGPDDKNTKFYRKRRMGGSKQMHYQRAIDRYRERFAEEMAAAIAYVVRRERAKRLILAGDEVAIPLLLAALPRETREIVHDDILRIHIRAPRSEVHEEIAPILAQMAEDDSHSIVERLVEGVRRGGLVVAGMHHTRQALEAGTVDTLVLDELAEWPREERASLIRLAGTSGAKVEIVPGNEALLAIGGVGGLLRYRLQDR